MRIDQLADRAAAELQDATRHAEFTVAAPGTARVRRRGIAAVAAGLLLVAVLGGTAWLMSGDAGDDVAAGRAEELPVPVMDQLGFVTLAGEAFPVADVVEAFEQAPMYESATGPELDPTLISQLGFGDESSIPIGTPKVADPDIIDGAAIYIGEVGAASAFLTQEQLKGGDYQKCLWIGPSPQICADLGVVAVHPDWDQTVAVWLGVPNGTVAVAMLDAEGHVLAWQAPRSRVVVFLVGDAEGLGYLAAYDASGHEILRSPIVESEIPGDDGSGVSSTTVP